MAGRTPRGPWHRVSAPDSSAASEVLKAAAHLIVPEDQTQRQALEELMPYLYVLKNKGCSFSQLAGLLSQCGFNLQPSSVRDYFRDMLATRMDICQERMNEQIVLMAEIRKETKGADLSAIAGRVAAVMDKRRSMAEMKIDTLFGTGAVPARSQDLVPRETAKLSRAATKQTGLRPASENHDPVSPEDSDSFGLLNIKPFEQKASKTSTFFGHDDGPVVQALNSNTAGAPRAAASPLIGTSKTKPQFRCLPLQDGVQRLKKRDNVPVDVYLPGDMEHPAIPGLMLSLEQRLYGAALEFNNGKDGEIRLETAEERRFRVIWKCPIPMTSTRTGETFTKMDESLFPNR